jgi:hypothetical protein
MGRGRERGGGRHDMGLRARRTTDLVSPASRATIATLVRWAVGEPMTICLPPRDGRGARISPHNGTNGTMGKSSTWSCNDTALANQDRMQIVGSLPVCSVVHGRPCIAYLPGSLPRLRRMYVRGVVCECAHAYPAACVLGYLSARSIHRRRGCGFLESAETTIPEAQGEIRPHLAKPVPPNHPDLCGRCRRGEGRGRGAQGCGIAAVHIVTRNRVVLLITVKGNMPYRRIVSPPLGVKAPTDRADTRHAQTHTPPLAPVEDPSDLFFFWRPLHIPRYHSIDLAGQKGVWPWDKRARAVNFQRTPSRRGRVNCAGARMW